MERALNRFGIIKNYMMRKYDLDAFPSEIVMETTNRCNLRCTMCAINHMKRKVGDIDINNFKRFVDEIKGRVELVYLHGLGEPLLHPQIIDMIGYCRAKGLRCGMSTNATVLDEKMSREILKAGLDYMILAFDGAKKETFERVRKNADFDKVKNNIGTFLRVKRSIPNKNFTVVQMVLMDETMEELKAFLSAWRSEKGIDAVRTKRHIDLRFVNNNKERPGVCDKPCFYLWRQANIYWDGTMSLCCMANDNEEIVGNIFKDGGFEKVWNSEKMKDYRRLHAAGKYADIRICRKCDIPQPSYLAIGALALADAYWMRKVLPAAEKMRIFGEFSA